MMKRRAVWFAAAATVVLIVAMPITLRQTGSARVAAAPEVEEPQVRVEQEFITVEPTSPPVMHVSAMPSIQRAVPAPRVTRASQPTFGERAKRALLGDGRHRPEPFPRAR